MNSTRRLHGETLAAKLQVEAAQSFVKSWRHLLQRITETSAAPESART